MKLVGDLRAPNTRRVKMFLAEKGITIPMEHIDMNKSEHKTPEFTALNPLQRFPVIILDDGTVIAESVAISRYFEETQPQPALFGTGAVERAQVEMWNRRMELNLLMSIAQAFRHLHPAMKEFEVPQVAAWGEANKSRASDMLKLLDNQLASNTFIAGENFSIADITAIVAVDFARPARVAVPEELINLGRWRAAVSSRESAKA